jgi:alginate O-acetyltransferase complex protein AlgI
MLFNSIEFLLFLPTVFLLYWFVCNKNLKLQNFLIVVVSYFFYGWWDWRFLFLIAFSSLLDYGIAYQLKSCDIQNIRKRYLCLSILVNISFLGVFKYFNFFIDSFVDAFSFFGIQLNKTTLNIILPVGISFYTFQTLSYTIDVYKRKLEATTDFIAFLAFVSFFPQLVAGPIERASNLLPQFYKKREFDYANAVDGLRQILWGLFKKMVIADNCGELANIIFNNYTDYSGVTLVFGAIFFSFQIYGDFSGYSDIAIGTSRLFGFNLKRNFAFPYFSRDVAEFWRRWHISLSTWFRDYIYIPLGGSEGGMVKKLRNTFVIFLVSGFWHGANWTYVAWGAINAIYFVPLLLMNKNRKNLDVIAENRFFPKLPEFLSMIGTYILITYSWIYFRSDSVFMAWDYSKKILSFNSFKQSIVEFHNKMYWDWGYYTLVLLVFCIVIEWFGRKNEFAIEKMFLKSSIIIRWGGYIILILLISIFKSTELKEFIYFQF